MTRKRRGNVWLGVSGLVLNSVGEWLVVRKSYGGMKGMSLFPVGFVIGGNMISEIAKKAIKRRSIWLHNLQSIF